MNSNSELPPYVEQHLQKTILSRSQQLSHKPHPVSFVCFFNELSKHEGIESEKIGSELHGIQNQVEKTKMLENITHAMHFDYKLAKRALNPTNLATFLSQMGNIEGKETPAFFDEGIDEQMTNSLRVQLKDFKWQTSEEYASTSKLNPTRIATNADMWLSMRVLKDKRSLSLLVKPTILEAIKTKRGLYHDWRKNRSVLLAVKKAKTLGWISDKTDSDKPDAQLALIALGHRGWSNMVDGVFTSSVLDNEEIDTYSELSTRLQFHFNSKCLPTEAGFRGFMDSFRTDNDLPPSMRTAIEKNWDNFEELMSIASGYFIVENHKAGRALDDTCRFDSKWDGRLY